MNGGRCGAARRRVALLLALIATHGCAPTLPARHASGPTPPKPRVIVLVWDGLRPDSVDVALTPRLAALAARGTVFTDHHATYPTFTMMNAASFATGAAPGQTGFYGNTLWQPRAAGQDSAGQPLPFAAPIFTEDYWVLDALNASSDGHLLLADTLFHAAKSAGLKTSVVGKSGPAFLQDLGKGDVLLDEKVAWPPPFAEELQRRGFALPKFTDKVTSVSLKVDNGDPLALGPKKFFDDGVTPDPTDASGTLCHSANRYLMDTFSEAILPLHDPDLSLVWLRNPDTTQHLYGPGSPNAKDALASQDLLLGMLLDRLELRGLSASTDLLIVSDHAHSTVSGPAELFPLRQVRRQGTASTWGEIAERDGFSVSGDVRLAHLLTRAGFSAYDGLGCVYDPVMSGITREGVPLLPTQLDATGTICGTAQQKYTTPSYKLPAAGLPASAVVIATNGGSDYLYVPDHDSPTVAKVVRFLQSREEIGAIFVAPRYGALPGTLSLATLALENAAGRSPDLVVSYNHDEKALVQGMRGTVFQSAGGSLRGMHGSFSPIDVHNTLIASGPHFRAQFRDPLPSANVDVAPTLARLLGLRLPSAQGRVLEEALRGGRETKDYAVSARALAPDRPAIGLVVVRATGVPDPSRTSYTFAVQIKDLSVNGNTYRYFDSAMALRR